MQTNLVVVGAVLVVVLIIAAIIVVVVVLVLVVVVVAVVVCIVPNHKELNGKSEIIKAKTITPLTCETKLKCAKTTISKCRNRLYQPY